MINLPKKGWIFSCLILGVFLLGACDFMESGTGGFSGEDNAPGISIIDPSTGGPSIDFVTTLPLGVEEPKWEDFVRVGYNTALDSIVRVKVDPSWVGEGAEFGGRILGSNEATSNEAGAYKIVYKGSFDDPFLVAPGEMEEVQQTLTVVVKPLTVTYKAGLHPDAGRVVGIPSSQIFTSVAQLNGSTFRAVSSVKNIIYGTAKGWRTTGGPSGQSRTFKGGEPIPPGEDLELTAFFPGVHLYAGTLGGWKNSTIPWTNGRKEDVNLSRVGALVMAKDGTMYVATQTFNSNYGANNVGQIGRISPEGVFTILVGKSGPTPSGPFREGPGLGANIGTGVPAMLLNADETLLYFSYETGVGVYDLRTGEVRHLAGSRDFQEGSVDGQGADARMMRVSDMLWEKSGRSLVVSEAASAKSGATLRRVTVDGLVVTLKPPSVVPYDIIGIARLGDRIYLGKAGILDLDVGPNLLEYDLNFRATGRTFQVPGGITNIQVDESAKALYLNSDRGDLAGFSRVNPQTNSVESFNFSALAQMRVPMFLQSGVSGADWSGTKGVFRGKDGDFYFAAGRSSILKLTL